MKKILKYWLKVTVIQEVMMPDNAEILCIQTQNDKPCLWAMVNDELDTKERYIEIIGTGHEIPVDMGIDRRYISTFQLHGGSLVFHAFERL